MVKNNIGAWLTAIETGAVDRWLSRRGLSRKTRAAVKAIGLYLALNAFAFGAAYILVWFFKSPVGHWLELDGKPARPYVPGTIWVGQIFLLIQAFLYYRDEVKRP